MTSWKRWLKIRLANEGFGDDNEDPASKFKLGQEDNDFADDHEKTGHELFDVLMSKYPEETTNFITQISSRGDQEIASLFRKFHKNNNMNSPKPRHNHEPERVVPAMADVGKSPDFDG